MMSIETALPTNEARLS